MKQLTQQLKSGKMEILEVPFPVLRPNEILVRNHYSLISSGTESKTVSDARKGYVAKARNRKKEVQQVIDMIKNQGFSNTYQFVMNKLDAPSSLGYSCAGEVIAAGDQVHEFKVGDLVACGGNSANHADVVSVPVNLAVRCPDISMKEAAFTTLGAIALQGIRQAELNLGERCLIIGMGLVGQLSAKVLQASAIQCACIDISEEAIKHSKAAGIQNVFNRHQDGLEEILMEQTGQIGFDSILITAGSSSLDPVELAGQLARVKAKVVIVGAVPTGFDRKNYYQKELDLRMSKSYGPGRGDRNYEEKGQDYPVGFVRWTENRNMQAFVELIRQKKIELQSLISHCFPLEDATQAYDLILSKNGNANAILIEYEKDKELVKQVELSSNPAPEKGNVGLIGAGKFAQGTLLPAMKGLFSFKTLVNSKGNVSRYVGEKYAFKHISNQEEDLFNDPGIDTVFICTRHDSHARLVIEAIKSGKHIFVEKPLAIRETELEEIRLAYREAVEQGYSKQVIVGFNRRFAPAIQELKKQLTDAQRKSILIRVNAGKLAPDHWVNDPEVGGGRIIGECCHFVDLAMHIAGSRIKSVHAHALDSDEYTENTVQINLHFENGSMASIAYFSNGSKLLSKEFIEVFSAGNSYQIDDFKTLHRYGKSHKKTKYRTQDKGHLNEMKRFSEALKKGEKEVIPFQESLHVTQVCFDILRSIRESRQIEVLS
ncbi:MAG: oxidoreductase [Bacteroidetes bacterium]|nr:MAG: oxidoreductase [Bacteroidota bacterium]